MSGNWQDYFEYKRCWFDKRIRYYEYKDKGVKTLPSNLRMPPTDTFYNMFCKCDQLEDITALANWDVSNIKDMSGMFYGCNKLQDISALANWDVSNVENMWCMFSHCTQLEDITALANWNVSIAKDMSYMFDGCKQFDISNDPSDIESLIQTAIPSDLPSDWQGIELPQWNP